MTEFYIELLCILIAINTILIIKIPLKTYLCLKKIKILTLVLYPYVIPSILTLHAIIIFIVILEINVLLICYIIINS